MKTGRQIVEAIKCRIAGHRQHSDFQHLVRVNELNVLLEWIRKPSKGSPKSGRAIRRSAESKAGKR